jgi:hypothetical protein
MKIKVRIPSAILAMSCVYTTMLVAQTNEATQDPFKVFRARPSSTLRFLTSEAGRGMASRFRPLAGYLGGMGINIIPEPDLDTAATVTPLPAPVVRSSVPCNSAAGALFNLEPAEGSPEIGMNVPQIASSLDYVPHAGISEADVVIATGDDFRGAMDQYLNVGDPNFEFDQNPNAWGYTMSGYYVHRSGSGCSPSFEGALPRIAHPKTQDMLYGYSPTVSADASRGLLYAVDVRYSAGINGLGLFATALSRINDPDSCPDGTHLTDSEGANATAAKCWPRAALLNPELNIFPSTFSDKPYVRADQRSTGVGAGDVYISWTNFDLFNGISYIEVLACPARKFTSPGACSSPLVISGSDPATQYSQIAIRPDGVFSVTYINVNFVNTDTPPYERQVFEIKHVYCMPNGAPNPPTCFPPTLLVTEEQPMPFPEGGPVSDPMDFPPATFPVHDYRMNANTAEEFVAWSRCNVDPYYAVGVLPFQYCFQPQIVVSWSVTDSSGKPLGWSTPIVVDRSRKRHLMPALQTDQSRGSIEVVYLNSEEDYFNERYQVFRAEIPAGSYQPIVVGALTSVPIEPNADPFLHPFIGENLGFAASMGRAYASFTGQAYTGVFGDRRVPGANNLTVAFSY